MLSEMQRAGDASSSKGDVNDGKTRVCYSSWGFQLKFCVEFLSFDQKSVCRRALQEVERSGGGERALICCIIDAASATLIHCVVGGDTGEPYWVMLQPCTRQVQVIQERSGELRTKSHPQRPAEAAFVVSLCVQFLQCVPISARRYLRYLLITEH